MRTPLSLHKYLYGNGNPVNQNDPSGYGAGAITAEQLIVLGIMATLVTMSALLLVDLVQKIRAEVKIYELPNPAPLPAPSPSPLPPPLIPPRSTTIKRTTAEASRPKATESGTVCAPISEMA